MEQDIEDRIEPEIEIGPEPREYPPPSGYNRPSLQPSFKKWGFGLIILVVLGLLLLGSWLVLPSGIFFNKNQTETPEQKTLKAEVQKLRSESDLLKNDIRSIKDGQKTLQEQTKNLLDQLKGLKDQQTLLEKKIETREGKRPLSKAIVYKVKKGDTLRSIAQEFQVRPEDIRRWNRLPGKSLPTPGQKITVHSPTAP